MSDLIDLLGHLASFWIFVINKKYREIRIKEWKESSVLWRIGMVLEGSISFVIGIGLPGILLWYLVVEPV